jgi:hypothetical protein
MRLLAVVASLVVAASAQQLLVYSDSALPACAQQCTVLQNAQTGCIPPAAPVTDATIYESCFCQSGYLTTLKAAGSTICSDVCGASDVAKIASWYQSNCADNGVAAAARVSSGTPTDSTSATGVSTVASTVPTTTAGSSSSSQSSSSSHNTEAHHDWYVSMFLFERLRLTQRQVDRPLEVDCHAHRHLCRAGRSDAHPRPHPPPLPPSSRHCNCPLQLWHYPQFVACSYRHTSRTRQGTKQPSQQDESTKSPRKRQNDCR